MTRLEILEKRRERLAGLCERLKAQAVKNQSARYECGGLAWAKYYRCVLAVVKVGSQITDEKVRLASC